LSGTDIEGPRFVMDAAHQQCYPEHDFIVMFGDAFAEHFAKVTVGADTPRKLMRALRGLPRDHHHKAVLASALKLLRKGEGLVVDAVHRMGGSVVATFAV